MKRLPIIIYMLGLFTGEMIGNLHPVYHRPQPDMSEVAMTCADLDETIQTAFNEKCFISNGE